jgi:hypothetical protein
MRCVSHLLADMSGDGEAEMISGSVFRGAVRRITSDTSICDSSGSSCVSVVSVHKSESWFSW